MAQQTSELWKQLWETKDTEKEYRFEIDGVEYDKEAIISQTVSNELYDEFSIGNASTAKLTLSIIAEDVPRGATVKRYVRLVNGEQASEWLLNGVYFVNRRAEEDGAWNIEAFDVMRKAEKVWEPRGDILFPMTMADAVNEFASLIGCEIDQRTTINKRYTIDYPANDYTIRQELQSIAAAHGGNWIITGEGNLLLVPLLSTPPETNYLVTEHGNAITLGGVRILVG